MNILEFLTNINRFDLLVVLFAFGMFVLIAVFLGRHSIVSRKRI